MMRASTHARLCLAQLLMMLGVLFTGAYFIRDHNWPHWCIYALAVVVALLAYLIPTKDEAYLVTSGMSSRRYWIIFFLFGRRQAEFSRWLTPPKNSKWKNDDAE